MAVRAAAELAVLLHVAFLMFVVAGALLIRRWRPCRSVHQAALGWGVVVSITPLRCPLTVIEQRLRARSGGGYEGGFIQHYGGAVLTPFALLLAQAAFVALTAVTVLASYRSGRQNLELRR